MKKSFYSRRVFIKMAVMGSGSMLFFPRCTGIKSTSGWRFFTEREASLVNVIIEQIIPTDEWPGAKDAGVANFIDKQLVGPYTRFQEKYRTGLALVEVSCEKLYRKRFENMLWDEQKNFLKKMEAGKLSGLVEEDKVGSPQPGIWEKGKDKDFFGLIRDHTMQGFYGSPRHGGNRNYVSYKMVGLDYPFIIGQNRYKS